MKITETEIWRTVVYNGEIYDNYQVSNFGNIMSLNYHQTGRAELLKPGKTKDGYLKIVLSKNGETDNCIVHRLVAQTFLPNPENKPYINHKIEGKKGKTMNMVIFNEDGTVDEKKTTIEWVTAKENINYGTCIERAAKAKINGKRSKKVLQFTLDGEFVREWPSTKEVGRNGFDQSSVSKCCRGELPHYKGFLWRYK